MNGTDRLERELTAWFADTAAPQTPDWTADILAATATDPPAAALVVPGTLAARGRRSAAAAADPAAGSVADDRSPRAAWPPAGRSGHALRGQPAAAPGTVRTGGERPRRLCRARRDLDRRPGHRENEKAIVTLTGRQQGPRFSRDGTRIAFLPGGRAGRSLAITNADGSAPDRSRRAPFVGADTDSIAWSPDGRRRGERCVQPTRGADAANDLPRRYDHGRGPGPRHPGRRCRGVLAPARRAPTDVHTR